MSSFQPIENEMALHFEMLFFCRITQGPLMCRLICRERLLRTSQCKSYFLNMTFYSATGAWSVFVRMETVHEECGGSLLFYVSKKKTLTVIRKACKLPWRIRRGDAISYFLEGATQECVKTIWRQAWERKNEKWESNLPMSLFLIVVFCCCCYCCKCYTAVSLSLSLPPIRKNLTLFLLLLTPFFPPFFPPLCERIPLMQRRLSECKVIRFVVSRCSNLHHPLNCDSIW